MKHDAIAGMDAAAMLRAIVLLEVVNLSMLGTFKTTPCRFVFCGFRKKNSFVLHFKSDINRL